MNFQDGDLFMKLPGRPVKGDLVLFIVRLMRAACKLLRVRRKLVRANGRRQILKQWSGTAIQGLRKSEGQQCVEEADFGG